MTREQFCELTAQQLGYDRAEMKLHYDDVWMCASNVIGGLIAQYVKQYGKSSIGAFCMPMVLPIQFDKVRNLPYVDLGTQVVALDRNTGVIQIGTQADINYGYPLLEAGMWTTYSHLEAGGMLGMKSMWREGNKLYSQFLDAMQTEIQVIAVPSLFYLTDYSDEIPMPLDFGDMLIQATRQRFLELKHTAVEDTAKGKDIIEGLKPIPNAQ